MNELKKQYNKLIKIHNEIGKWLDDINVPIEEKEPRIPDFYKLIVKLGSILKKLKSKGIEFTEDEILNGFKIEGEAI